MCMLIVGGDQIKPIASEIKTFGFDEVIHWNCRKRSEANKPVPQKVDGILVLTSFLKHSTMKKIKSEAKRNAIPAFYAKRSRIDVHQALSCSDCSLLCTQGCGGNA